MTVRAGVAVRDITPDPGAAMSGFVARRQPASGVHDPLLVHALVVGDTAVVAVDVVGLHEGDCAEIRRRCPLPAENVVVHATHTHGGPASVRGRLGGPVDTEWLDRVVSACVDAVAEAAAWRVPAAVVAGYGADAGVARNRRRPDGPVDRALPVVRLVRDDGSTLAAVVSYACHPVVLGADNLELTADYPGVVRSALSERLGGSPVLFLTGCAGDVNTGHAAAASISTAAAVGRSFEECARVGRRVADAALGAPGLDGVVADGRPSGSGGGVGGLGRLGGIGPADASVVRAAHAEVALALVAPDPSVLAEEIASWERAAPEADDATAALLRCWADWGHQQLRHAPALRWTAPVSVLRWADAVLVALPGEPFAAAALEIRALVARRAPGATVVVAGYCNGSPGYLPTAEEYPRGGYEVCEAHRYYGMAGPFASGSLEAVVARAVALVDELV